MNKKYFALFIFTILISSNIMGATINLSSGENFWSGNDQIVCNGPETTASSQPTSVPVILTNRYCRCEYFGNSFYYLELVSVYSDGNKDVSRLEFVYGTSQCANALAKHDDCRF